MKIHLKWLKRYVQIPVEYTALVEIFPKLGLEVEGTTIHGAGFPSTLVVGEIIDIAAHPDADKLQVCRVKVDDRAPRQIVCGAKNFQLGDRVPVALPGTLMPEGFKIKSSKLRGVLSEGMMCSARELGISNDHEGLLILQDKPAIGMPLQEIYPTEDVTFELETTSNRGDLLSHWGIARELAAFFRKPLSPPISPIYPESTAYGTFSKKISISSSNAPYYCLFEIRDVTIGESPKWLQEDLKAIGLHPINNAVDISNWILFDCGQPLHAFDADKVEGDTIHVRQAKCGESLQTLDGQTRPLSDSVLVIADDQKILSIAGVMGGESSAIQKDTRHIFLESAYFRPESIRQSTKILGLRSDSSYRFERDVDPGMTLEAGQRAVQMILEICGGTLVGLPQIQGQVPRDVRRITLDPTWVAERCGVPLDPMILAEHLNVLGYSVDISQMPWEVSVPSYRSDVSRPIDLVEEFLRIYGNENIPISAPSFPVYHRNNTPIADYFQKVAHYLCHRGATECYNDSFRSAAEVHIFGKNASSLLELENPIVEPQSHLRFSLIPGLLDTARHNLQNKNDLGNPFENGHVFIPNENKLWEIYSTTCLYSLGSLRRHWDEFRAPHWTEIKATAVAMAKIARIPIEPLFQRGAEPEAMWQAEHRWHFGNLFQDGYRIQIGILDLAWCHSWELPYPIAAIEIHLLPRHFERPSDEVHFEPFSLYPKASRDLSLLVDRSTTAEEIRSKIESLAKRASGRHFNVQDVSIFDVYEGEGLSQNKKNIALAIDFYSDKRTLKEQEVQHAFEQLQHFVSQETPYEIRRAKDLISTSDKSR
ncbi:MAG: phenylalanine--tRNA ligase subunit beta [Puniceicoccales bacterium]|jgi:phenylalanyl-tRNA synthetase beta chain|nr:phenylalanine--tRNA ligase subunit beta [Puniceicoccales bacterium]